MKLLDLIKRKWYIFVLILLTVIAIILRLITPQINKFNSWNGLVFDRSTAQDIQNKLGVPIKTDVNGDTTVLSYKSDYPHDPTQIALQNDKLNLVVERISLGNSKSYDALFQSLGPNYFIQYTPYMNDLFPLYVFSSQGIAIARSSDGVVFEIWHFLPMSPELFRATVGKETAITEFKDADQAAPTPPPEEEL